MTIVSLFCEIDDFFLTLETYQVQRQLSVLNLLKNAGVPGTYIPVRS